MARYKRRKYSHKPGREKDAGRCADDRRFEEFVKEHNAAAGRFAAADDDIQAAEDRAAAEDFAEKHLIRMRRSLGVME